MNLPSLLKRVANRSLDILFVPPFDRLFASRFRGAVVCLLYHRVSEPGAEPFLDNFGAPPIPPIELERELRLLAGWGVRFMTVDELLRGVWPDPDETGVIVTFDDGYRDTYENGLPVLESLGIRATIFQASRMLADRAELIWEHELYAIAAHPAGQALLAQLVRDNGGIDLTHRSRGIVHALREDTSFDLVADVLAQAQEITGARDNFREIATRVYPNAALVRAAQERGHEIGSHGCRHLKRNSISGEVFKQEVAMSSMELETLCGRAPRCFSYPFNCYVNGDQEIVAKHFEVAFTVNGGPIKSAPDPQGVPRFTWPGPHQSALRRRRWLRTGHI